MYVCMYVCTYGQCRIRAVVLTDSLSMNQSMDLPLQCLLLLVVNGMDGWMNLSSMDSWIDAERTHPETPLK